MADKVYRLFQLMRNGNVFDLNQRKEIRSSVKISESLAEMFNSNALDSGKLYVINEEETERLFGKPKKVVEEVKKKDEDPPANKTFIPTDQQKYDKRKSKMIEAGFVFDSEQTTFTKGNDVITGAELLALNNVKYGKLLK